MKTNRVYAEQTSLIGHVHRTKAGVKPNADFTFEADPVFDKLSTAPATKEKACELKGLNLKFEEKLGQKALEMKLNVSQ